MRVLIGCEFSGVMRRAFRNRGHDAWSNDILPAEDGDEHHIRGDVWNALTDFMWDLAILHVDCTKMAVCGNRWHAGTVGREEAIMWTIKVWRRAVKNVSRVALENPASVIFPHLRFEGADVQYVQPWQFGHPEQKKTGFALHNLPRLKPTKNVYAEMMLLSRKERERIFFMSPGKNRGLDRARTFPGLADAVAYQWGSL